MGFYILKTRGNWDITRRHAPGLPGEKELWTDWNRAFDRFVQLSNDGYAPIMWSDLPQAKPDWSKVPR